MKTTAIVPAAGAGTRLGRGPKAWLELRGRPLLSWVSAKLGRVADTVVVAVREADLERARTTLPSVHVIVGGATRQATIELLVEAAHTSHVLLQDVARPFVSEGLLARVVREAGVHGAAAAFVSPEVPVARLEDGWVRHYLSADQAGVFQAPQAFAREPLAEVVRDARRAGVVRQSTAQLWLDAGLPLRAVPGEKRNLKLTTEADWELADLYGELL